MKKSYLLIIAAGLFCLAACNKEMENTETPESPDSSKMITETITASLGSDTKVTIADGGGFAWTAGDDIAVHVSNESGSHKYVVTTSGASAAAASASFTVSYEEGYSRDAFAVYPSTIVATDAANYGQEGVALDVTLPNTYTLDEVSGTTTPSPMIADNTGSGWVFKHLCGLLRLSISGIPADATQLRIGFNGRKVSGDFAIPMPVAADGSSTITSIDGTPGTDDYIWVTGLSSVTSVTITLPLPTGVAYTGLSIVACDVKKKPLQAQLTAFTYTASNAHGKKVSSELTLDPYGFSIGGGTQVKFASGNLQYQAKGDDEKAHWRFAAHQYDYIGEGNTNIGSEYSGWIDLFGWGTSGWENTDDSWINYQPWSTDASDHSGDHPNNKYGYGPEYDAEGDNNNLTGTNAKGDWGVNNIGDSWRTPTKAECIYIFSSRYISRYALGRIDLGDSKYINGLFVFPDGYVHPDGLPVLTYINKSWYYTNNTFNISQWEQMETAGVAFLPAAGQRDGKTIAHLNNRGRYWSTTSTSPNGAYPVYFTPGYFKPATESGHVRYIGYSIRLIRNL